MQLSEEKTYRTRDGKRTGIRVRPQTGYFVHHQYPWRDEERGYTENGRAHYGLESSADLIEEQPADRPFSYDACPVHEDGRRRAVTRDGQEVVLLCDDAPTSRPIVGVILGGLGKQLRDWDSKGSAVHAPRFDSAQSDMDLLVPLLPKCAPWFNLYPNGMWTRWETEERADAQDENMPKGDRLSGRSAWTSTRREEKVMRWTEEDRAKFKPGEEAFTLIGYRYMQPHSEDHETLEGALAAGNYAFNANTWAAYEVLDRAGRPVADRDDICLFDDP